MKEIIKKHFMEIILWVSFLITLAVVILDEDFMSNPLFFISLTCFVCGVVFGKRNKDLKEELEYIKEENEYAKKKNKILVKTLKEQEEKEKEKDESRHIVGISCIGCKNLLSEHIRLPNGGETTQKSCKLDCKCGDRIDE